MKTSATQRLVGTRVRLSRFRDDWVVAEHHGDGYVHVRSEVRESSTVVAGYWGSQPLFARNRYVWMSVPLADVTICADQREVAGVVTGLLRSADSFGPYPSATVGGEQFPVAGSSEPTWVDLFETLYRSGFVVPPDVPVQISVSDGAMECGVYRLSAIRELLVPPHLDDCRHEEGSRPPCAGPS